LKEDSVQAHRLWQEHCIPNMALSMMLNGVPKLNTNTRKADRQEIVTFSNKLHDYLNKKDQTAFWNT